MKLNLSSSEFQSRWLEFFEHSYVGDDYVDVTLATSDGQCINAHKLILSASSVYLRRLIKANPHPHPMIMVNLDYEALHDIIRYVYRGDILLEESRLSQFLANAKMLEIEGLMNPADIPVVAEAQDFPAEAMSTCPNSTVSSESVLDDPLLGDVSMETSPSTINSSRSSPAEDTRKRKSSRFIKRCLKKKQRPLFSDNNTIKEEPIDSEMMEDEEEENVCSDYHYESVTPPFTTVYVKEEIPELSSANESSASLINYTTHMGKHSTPLAGVSFLMHKCRNVSKITDSDKNDKDYAQLDGDEYDEDEGSAQESGPSTSFTEQVIVTPPENPNVGTPWISQKLHPCLC